jgi:hypothetical protein
MVEVCVREEKGLVNGLDAREKIGNERMAKMGMYVD